MLGPRHYATRDTRDLSAEVLPPDDDKITGLLHWNYHIHARHDVSVYSIWDGVRAEDRHFPLEVNVLTRRHDHSHVEATYT